jgi:outer membrane protein assembly factor BamD
MLFRAALLRYPLLLAVVGLFFLPARLHADLVWTPEGGWKLEGGVVANLTGEESRNALDLMNKARAREEKGHYLSALSAYKKVTKRYPNSIYAPEAFYRTGYIRLTRRQYLKAFLSFQEIVMRYPGTLKFNQVIGEQYRIASALLDGARGRGWLIFPGFKNRESSIGLFEQILVNAPYSEYAPLSLMSIAKAHQLLNEPEEAIDALDRMINTYPKSLLTPDAYLRLAQAHASRVEGPNYDQTSTKEAITYYEDYMILYPGDPNIGASEKGLAEMKQVLAESKIRIADFYFKYRRNYKAAKVFYNEAITDYPDSPVAAKARGQLTKVDALLAAQEKAVTGRSEPPPPQPKKKKRFLFF